MSAPLGPYRKAALTVSLLCRVYLGYVFIWAALYKIAEPHQFALSIATYDILPLELVNAMAMILPWIEIATGLTLIAGFWTRASALAICGMMIMFIVALSIALSNDLHMSCGCFASVEAEDEINALTLLRDFAWTAAGVFVLIADDGRWGTDGWLRRRKRERKTEGSAAESLG
ncbi:MAG: DoxX family membrane protein [Deltaproteobacteria bacterium]|nr:DoxX family membrane protein [Deltaproteobacteria bacterium]